MPSPRFIPESVFYTQSVMLSPRFIPESVFYTQSVVRSPQSMFYTEFRLTVLCETKPLRNETTAKPLRNETTAKRDFKRSPTLMIVFY